MPSNLATLYEGALLGQSFSKKLGQFQAESDERYNEVRGNLLATGVASGKINPASLSKSDASLLGQDVQTGGFGPNLIPSPSHPKSIFGDILGLAETPFKIALNTAGDFASAVEGLPSGLATLGTATYNTATGGKGPNLGDVGKAIASSTLHDFTNFDPMHPLFPAMDLATLLSFGAGAAARGGATLARIGEGESAVAKAGAAIANAVKPGVRPNLTLGSIETDVNPGFYSISPTRRLLEKGIDKFYASGYADKQIPGAVQGRTLQDARAEYHIRKMSHVIGGGRVTSGVVKNTHVATAPFAKAMVNLLKESNGSHVEAAEKFNALVLRRELNADHLTEAERAERIKDYIDRILKSPVHEQEIQGVATDTAQAKEIRKYYEDLINSDRYQNYFVKGTSAMETLKEAWDQAIKEGLRAIGLNPRELLRRALGPVAYLYEKEPEEILREQPELVQKQTRFHIDAYEIEKDIREAKGEHVMSEALANKIAADLPSSATVQRVGKDGVTRTAKQGINLARRQKLVKDAIRSLKADIKDGTRLHKHEDWYLAGDTLGHKVAAGLVDRLGVENHIAEPYAIGALTNWFPQRSTEGLKVRQQGFRLGRATETLSKGRFRTGAHELSLHEFRKEPTIRLLTAQQLGVAPYSDFMHDAVLSHFEAGLERRDLTTFVRHIAQRERVLLHRMLTAPLIERLALKENGEVKWFSGRAELANYIGDTEKAKRWVLVPHTAFQKMIMSEGNAAEEAAEALATADGRVTPAVSDAIDHAIDEEAQEFTRALADEVTKNKDRQVAMPKTYLEDLIRQTRTFEAGGKGITHYWQGFINRWRTAVLAYMPSWLLRTSIGHGVILYISGVTNPRHYLQSVTYFKDGFHVPLPERLGGKRSVPGPLGRGEDRPVVPGIEQGTPSEDFGRFGGQRVSVNKMAIATTTGVHRIANFQRRAAFLHLLDKTARQRWHELDEAFQLPRHMKSADYDYLIEHHPEFVHHALNELDRVSYTFGQMAPWERNLARNFIPFWGWYKFVNKFVWSLPITYPGRTLAIARLGELGESQQDQLGPLPDWLRTSVLYDTHNLSKVHYLSMLGLNPLGDIANPMKGFQGLIRLGQFSPVIQAGLEGAGYNTLTGGLEEIDPASGVISINGQYYNVHTGQVAESPGAASPIAAVERAIGGLARSFPEIRLAEPYTTGGRIMYPESIPFVYEKPIPGAIPKPVSPFMTLLRYGGIAPREYNLANWQLKTLTNLSRARGIYLKAIQKSEAIQHQP